MDKIFRRGLALVLAGAFLAGGSLRAQNTNAPDSPDDSGTYVPPAGGPPPVAPPLNPNSPLYHLAHDTKYTAPTVGYREGNTSGSEFWIAHRGIDTDGGEGWGWIRKGGGGWKWIALQETPGLAIAPHRRLASAIADAEWEYKFWGYLASYRAYDPHLDELVPVFVLQGYVVLGPANPLTAKIGPPGRIHSRRSGASSRSSSPILSDPGVD
jgi:hypothetical protein